MILLLFFFFFIILVRFVRAVKLKRPSTPARNHRGFFHRNRNSRVVFDNESHSRVHFTVRTGYNYFIYSLDKSGQVRFSYKKHGRARYEFPSPADVAKPRDSRLPGGFYSINSNCTGIFGPYTSGTPAIRIGLTFVLRRRVDRARNTILKRGCPHYTVRAIGESDRRTRLVFRKKPFGSQTDSIANGICRADFKYEFIVLRLFTGYEIR